jgi:diguanylate cyclase (GGDEF)-like protein
MTGIWQKDSWLRLAAIALGTLAIALSLRHADTLPWMEILIFSAVSLLLRQRGVPEIFDHRGKIVLAHLPGESVLTLLILRHDASAAVCASLITNTLTVLFHSKTLFRSRSLWIASISRLFWLPFVAFLMGHLYRGFGGISVLGGRDCTQLFQNPYCVLLPLVAALLLSTDIVARCFRATTSVFVQRKSFWQAAGGLDLCFFDYLENVGALLALALWTTWGWGTLPFSLLILEALLLVAREHARRLEASKQADTDGLTGLANARGLSAALQYQLKKKGSSGALIYLDLDRFKEINDTYGHNAGDALLCLVAAALQSSVRSADLVARRGGDEFVLLLPGLKHADAHIVLGRIRSALQIAIQTDARFAHASLSTGVAVYPADATSEESLLHLADQKMYADKRRLHAPKVA